ncbi:MAG: acyl-CoA desaturase [Actinobacteria bacterium]|nr:MAG: acyl-CoA desaturase [Actinomycetota bacterium]
MAPTSVLDRPVRRSAPKPPDERINRTSSIPFLALHLVPLLAIFTGVSRTDLIVCAALYLGRMFFITAGYHRYFAHRSYKMARVPQFLMALGGTTAAQKGPLWWAAHHRDHHRYADTDRDIHSPSKGFWWSHVGWFLSDRFKATNVDGIRDFARYPELRWLDRHDWVGAWALGAVTFLLFGWSGLVVGFFVSTILLWHGTFLVNSVAHVFGRRRYETDDTSRNSLLVALATGGEGWHNNHHHYPASARQGFFWWEIDPTWYGLRILSWVGLVRGLRTPPERVLVSDRAS